MNESTKAKIMQTAALKDKTIADILETDVFKKNIAAYLKAQREDRSKAKEYIWKMAKHVRNNIWPKSHVIDRLDYLTPDNFAFYFGRVLEHRSRLPKSERDYIDQIGRQAFNKTIADIAIAERPELELEIYSSLNNQSNEDNN